MSEEQTVLDTPNLDLSFETSDIKSDLDRTIAGGVPDDWILVRLGELTNDTLYGANESAEDFDTNKPRYIRITDISDTRGLENGDKASLPVEKAEGYLLSEGDMLFARSGSVGKTYLYDPTDGECCYGGYSIKHELKSEGLNREYLYQFTTSNRYWKWVNRITRTGAQPNINSREYASILIPLPPLEEQHKIASVLYTVDQSIQKTQEVIDQLDRIRQGVRQDILTRGVKNKEGLRPSPEEHPSHYSQSREWLIPRSWDLRELSEVASLQVGYAFSSEWYRDEGQVRVLRGANVGYGTADWSDTKYLEIERVPEYDEYRLEGGDLIIGMDRPYTSSGFKITRLSDADVPSLLVQRVGRYQANNIVEDFLHVVLKDWRYQKQLLRQAQGMDIPHISKTDILSAKIPVPPADEQEGIAEVYRTIRSRIHSERSLHSRFMQLKQGLMQDLLSGKVRIHDKDIEIIKDVLEHG